MGCHRYVNLTNIATVKSSMKHCKVIQSYETLLKAMKSIKKE